MRKLVDRRRFPSFRSLFPAAHSSAKHQLSRGDTFFTMLEGYLPRLKDTASVGELYLSLMIRFSSFRPDFFFHKGFLNSSSRNCNLPMSTPSGESIDPITGTSLKPTEGGGNDR